MGKIIQFSTLVSGSGYSHTHTHTHIIIPFQSKCLSSHNNRHIISMNCKSAHEVFFILLSYNRYTYNLILEKFSIQLSCLTDFVFFFPHSSHIVVYSKTTIMWEYVFIFSNWMPFCNKVIPVLTQIEKKKKK